VSLEGMRVWDLKIRKKKKTQVERVDELGRRRAWSVYFLL
jgi:hypothetical protein